MAASKFDDFSGKVVIVSGGVHGIGRAIAESCLARGACVLVCDILDDKGEDFAALMTEHHGSGRVLYRHLDVRDAKAWSAAVSDAEVAFGAVNGLVNNAGMPSRAGLEDTTEEQWDLTIDVDLKGTWLGTKACIPSMRKAGGGAIVNTSSTFGMVASGRATAYHSAKGGVTMLTKAAAVEYAKQGIRVNAIHPGITQTPRSEDMPQLWIESIVANTPLGRMAKAEEIAAGAVFLLSDAASFITGASLVIDGGYTAA